ncbi:diguanylate cyclase domain-containing protein [Leptolyngbya sp. AN02str]|uniref:diguanylate cyclase n=1 Tax=Leptolyngbya sp. AN02str TaxID=3423363 RepID=UPI003D32304C
MSEQFHSGVQVNYLLAEVERLQREIAQLQRSNQDLQMALVTTAEHGDVVEAQLQETNERLHAEVLERKRAEAALEAIVRVISRQKDDLEIILHTITEHGDVLDAQWLEKVNQANLLATSDGLTHIANRRRFDDYLRQQWQHLARERSPLSVLLCDIDYFKQYNDTYGHLQGDDCLREVARVLNQSVRRPSDLVARYGGEEFAIILPNTPLDGARTIAQDVLKAVANLHIPHGRSPISPVLTISIGLACQMPDLTRSPNTILEIADRLLYQAKLRGRNQIAD